MNKKIVQWKNKNVWIVGASQGIGRAFAIELAKRGAKLNLSARNEEALREIQNQFPEQIKIYPLDVLDVVHAKNIVATFSSIDLLVYFAADYTPMGAVNFNAVVANKMIDVNLKGAMNVIDVTLKKMITQKHGHLSVVASIAGYIGLPDSSVYGATKAALINLCESLYNDAKPLGIDVSVVNPGFVKTRLTDKNNFEMPFIMDAETAAKHIVKGYEKGDFAIVFPKTFSYFFRLIRLLPYFIHLRIVKKLVKT